jgi:hypothetical protein
MRPEEAIGGIARVDRRSLWAILCSYRQRRFLIVRRTSTEVEGSDEEESILDMALGIFVVQSLALALP